MFVTFNAAEAKVLGIKAGQYEIPMVAESTETKLHGPRVNPGITNGAVRFPSDTGHGFRAMLVCKPIGTTATRKLDRPVLR